MERKFGVDYGVNINVVTIVNRVVIYVHSSPQTPCIRLYPLAPIC